MRILEIFSTLEGEGKFAGYPTIFIRTAFCPVRCRCCDTGFKDKDLVTPYRDMTVEEIYQEIATRFPRLTHICVTGGEPTLEPDFADLIKRIGVEYNVHVETSGVVSLSNLFGKLGTLCSWVVDIKTPSLQCRGENIVKEWQWLGGGDVLKAIISDRADYDYVKTLLDGYWPGCEVYMSPVHDGAGFPLAKELAGWILEDGLEARLQLQMHKIIGVA